jgi:DNA gyrase subunit B
MSRQRRTLRRVRVSDAEAASTVFELLMGNEVAPRRDFIVSGPGVSRERIDA